MMTLKTEDAKMCPFATEIKGKCCNIVDPDNADVRTKPHRLPFQVLEQADGKAHREDSRPRA